MTKPLAHFLTGSVYDFILPGLFLLGLLALGVYLVFRVFAGRSRPRPSTTINPARRGETNDESGDGSNSA